MRPSKTIFRNKDVPKIIKSRVMITDSDIWTGKSYYLDKKTTFNTVLAMGAAKHHLDAPFWAEVFFPSAAWNVGCCQLTDNFLTTLLKTGSCQGHAPF